VISSVISLATTRYFYQTLGESGYATFILLRSAIAFSHLLAFGAHEAVMYFVAKPREQTWRRQSQALAALFLFGGILGSLIWVLAWLGFPAWIALGTRLEPEVALGLSQAIGAAGLLWLAQHFTQAAWAFYRARLRLVEVGWMQLGTAVVPVLAAVLAVYSGLGLNGFFLSQAAAWAAVGCLAFYAASKGPEPLEIRPYWHSAELAQTLGFARWAFLLQVSFTLQSYGDRFLAAPLGSSALNVYGIGTSLTLQIVAALGLVSTLIVPAISKVHAEHGLDRAGRAHGLALRSTFWVGAAFFVPLAAGGPSLLAHWVDPAFQAAAEGWYPWVCIGAFWMALAGSVHGTLLGLGRPRIVALTSMLGIVAGLMVAWALRAQGLLAVAGFGATASGVSLLTKAAWLHGRVLQRIQFGEMLAASGLLVALGWVLRESRWADIFGPGLIRCVAALGLASAGILLIGAAWDSLLSRARDRDSLVSVLWQRWGRKA
jgi:O-antigen/teichoic acid export membrane protein